MPACNRGLLKFSGPVQPGMFPWSSQIFASDLLANRPAACAANKGFMFFATGTRGGTLYRSTGSAWVQVAKPVNQTITTNTDGSTVTFDLDNSDKHIVTLGGARTLALSGGFDGQTFVVILKQDGTGSRTVTWWSNIKWSAGTTPTLTTTAAKQDVFSFIRISSTEFIGFSTLNF